MTNANSTMTNISGLGKLPISVDYKIHDAVFSKLIELNKEGFAALAKEAREVISNPKTTTAEILELNKRFQDLYKAHDGSTVFNTVEGNALSAIYPIPECLDDELKLSAEDKACSNILKKTNTNGFNKIAILPPISNSSYIALSNVYNQSIFLAKLMQAGSSIWAKYGNGRATPTSHSWGLLLLSLNLHPYYELNLRNNYQEYSKSNLFKAIFPNWDHEANSNFAQLKAVDLKPYSFFADIYKVEETTPAEYEIQFKELVTEFYSKKPSADEIKRIGFNSASELFAFLDSAKKELPENPSIWGKINKPIIELSGLKAFSHKKLKNYISAFSVFVTDDKELAEKISSVSQIGHYVYVESNYNNNIFPLLRLVSTEDGDFNTFKNITNIERGTWSRYEKGQRFPHDAVWSQALLALDLHPYYQLSPRKKNLEAVFEIYKHLHPVVDTSDNSGHFISATTTFDQFKASKN